MQQPIAAVRSKRRLHHDVTHVPITRETSYDVSTLWQCGLVRLQPNLGLKLGKSGDKDQSEGNMRCNPARYRCGMSRLNQQDWHLNQPSHWCSLTFYDLTFCKLHNKD